MKSTKFSATCALTAFLTLTLTVGACGGTKQATTTAGTPRPTPGNGIASKTPAEILNAAGKALASATSVHIRGEIGESGKNYQVDLVLGQNTAKGSMTGPIADVSDASFEFIVAGDGIYIRSSTLWRQLGGAAAANLIDGRWVLMKKSDFADFPFLGTQAFANAFRSGPSQQALSAGAVTTVNGQPAIPVTTTDSIIYVATTGQPYPLRQVARPAKGGTGSVNFFDFNAPVTVHAPQNPIDFAKLRGGG